MPASPSPVWRPFTQHHLDPAPPHIVRTQGAWLEDAQGRTYLDAISSWWVITHGHRHPVIMAAIEQAAHTLDQVIFAEFTHAPAEALARGLIERAPPGLTRVFYSDSGSTAVEVGIKMAFGFFHNQGIPRSRLVVMEHGYHGDTIGTMSAGARGVFNAPYAPLLFEVATLPFPEPGHEQATLDAFAAQCQTGEVAALLIEPLVLGAGGMKMYPAWVLGELKRIAEHAGVLLIADEVMTGWGRTGTLFACTQAALTPDILCLSKGLTGGALPLAATLCTEPIFAAHLAEDRRKTFFHSSSYTANPLACAAGLANLQVWDTEPVQARLDTLATHQRERLARFAHDPRFVNVRQCGTLTALDVRVFTPGYLSDIGPRLRRFFRERGVIIRPLGNVIYLMPPYCVTGSELDLAYEAIDEAVARIAGGTP
ncbi:adenosylmethionine--8-amino-7-oxononanoate transaminase [Pararhodospirillum photometricum]|nr:adenosylmethionine--8-amino-7-oxononanoate transaminase [Pararhodospirillum photometricum]